MAAGRRRARPATGEWISAPSEKSAELLLKVAERKARLCGLDRQYASLVATVTAEQVASFLGWDTLEPVIEVAGEEIAAELPGSHVHAVGVE